MDGLFDFGKGAVWHCDNGVLKMGTADTIVVCQNRYLQLIGINSHAMAFIAFIWKPDFDCLMKFSMVSRLSFVSSSASLS